MLLKLIGKCLNFFVAFTLRNLSWPVTVGQTFGSVGRLTVGTVFYKAWPTLHCQEVTWVVEEFEWSNKSIGWVAGIRTLTSTCDFQRKKRFQVLRRIQQNPKKLNWETIWRILSGKFCIFTYKTVARETRNLSQCTQSTLRQPANAPHCSWTSIKLRQRNVSTDQTHRHSCHQFCHLMESKVVDIGSLFVMGKVMRICCQFDFNFNNSIGLQKVAN